ncbi:MAG: alpha/beta hydrolase-fold protein [Phycisphaerae bacterium]|nr:alpha/beta hydrolase-fold protein [Phycisphaerae bacterium]
MTTSRACAPLAILACVLSAARADEAAILAHLKGYFGTTDVAQRAALVARIEADPAYERAKLRDWLHAADLFAPVASPPPDHLVTESIELEDHSPRTIEVRLPRQYDHRRAYPLIYALHGTGGDARGIISYMAKLLGDRLDEFVIAAPEGYGQFVIYEAGPSDEHTRALAHLRRRFHIDADRVHLTGYSRGGHGTWTLALMHADEFASGLALAGTFNMLGADALWEEFLPNVRGLPLWTVWGEDDTVGDAGENSPQGGIAGLNRKLRAACEKLALPCTFVELPDVGHGGVVPSAEVVSAWLAARRVAPQAESQRSFRWLYQARTDWLAGAAWAGSAWEDQQRFTVEPRPRETAQDAFHRELRARLGKLSGRIQGQTIEVRREHISELTIWLCDGMFDWSQPLTIKVSGREVFSGNVAPSLAVSLDQAAKSYDFGRLRWAGLQFHGRKKATWYAPSAR